MYPHVLLIMYSIATIINVFAIYLLYFKFNPEKCITVGNVAAIFIIILLGPVTNMIFLIDVLMPYDDFILYRW